MLSPGISVLRVQDWPVMLSWQAAGLQPDSDSATATAVVRLPDP
jgi:hypothetical protein